MRLAVILSGEPRCLPWNSSYINLFLRTFNVPYDVYVGTDEGSGPVFTDIQNVQSIVEISNEWQRTETGATNRVDRALCPGEITGLKNELKQKLIDYSKHRLLQVQDIKMVQPQIPESIGGLERQFISRHILQWIKAYAAWLSVQDVYKYNYILKIRSDLSFKYNNCITVEKATEYLHSQIFNGHTTVYGDRCYAGFPNNIEKLLLWPYRVNDYVAKTPPNDIIFVINYHGNISNMYSVWIQNRLTCLTL